MENRFDDLACELRIQALEKALEGPTPQRLHDYFVKTNGKLKYSNKGLKGASIYCVDTEFIVTDDVADVKMVFAASQWDGFILPKSDESEVKITMDIMVSPRLLLKI